MKNLGDMTIGAVKFTGKLVSYIGKVGFQSFLRFPVVVKATYDGEEAQIDLEMIDRGLDPNDGEKREEVARELYF